MKILVTGGSGFIGSQVVRHALAANHSVINVDCNSYAAPQGAVTDCEASPRYMHERVDIRNLEDLNNVFMKYSPDAVMHLAAESHVDRSIFKPAEFIETNVLGTFNLLQTSLSFYENHGYKSGFRFLHISTDEVFGSLNLGDETKFTESTRYDPRSPYSASKASSDHLVRAWYHTYGLPTIVTNCSNNYGPYQFPEKFIPKIILNGLRQIDIPIYGNGANVRDWLHVNDHVEALFSVLELGKAGSTYTIGGNNECDNLTLASTILEILAEDYDHTFEYKSLIKFVDDRKGHDIRYAIDNTKITSELFWQPKISLTEGLSETVGWYLTNQHWWQPILEEHGM